MPPSAHGAGWQGFQRLWVVSTPNNQKEPANQAAERYTEGVSLRAEQLTGTVQ